jgi:hypothetical protein
MLIPFTTDTGVSVSLSEEHIVYIEAQRLDPIHSKLEGTIIGLLDGSRWIVKGNYEVIQKVLNGIASKIAIDKGKECSK